MTQGKHTPGPWAWVKDKSDWGGTWLFSDETPVLDYAGCGSHDTEIGEADARLIAAAPDMLEALRPFADCADELDEEREWDDEEWAKFRLLVKHYRAARAAIAKAEGK